MDKRIPHIKKRFDEMYPIPLRLEYIDNSYARYSVMRTRGLLNRLGILGYDNDGKSNILYNDYPQFIIEQLKEQINGMLNILEYGLIL